jgi:hypothetical protein
MWRVLQLQERRNSKKLGDNSFRANDKSSETIIAYYVVVQKTTKTSFYRWNTAKLRKRNTMELELRIGTIM